MHDIISLHTEENFSAYIRADSRIPGQILCDGYCIQYQKYKKVTLKIHEKMSLNTHEYFRKYTWVFHKIHTSISLNT